MQLRWRWMEDLSALHAAWCIAHFPERCEHCGDGLREAATQLDQLGQTLVAVPRSWFWYLALELSIEGQRNQDLAERLLVRLNGPAMRNTPTTNNLVAAIGAVEREFRRQFPNFQSEIQLRKEPIKQLWEAHGPGLLFQVGRTTEPQLLVDSAEVFLVQPVLGGAGAAHLGTNRVHLEGVLTHADPQLPETLRLAWLLSQLHCDLPMHSDRINTQNLQQLAGLAFVPPVLLGAAELGLADFSIDALERAIRVWAIPTGNQGCRATAEVLMVWWDTYSGVAAGAEDRAAWNTALTGLDRLLSA